MGVIHLRPGQNDARRRERDHVDVAFRRDRRFVPQGCTRANVHRPNHVWHGIGPAKRGLDQDEHAAVCERGVQDVARRVRLGVMP